MGPVTSWFGWSKRGEIAAALKARITVPDADANELKKLGNCAE